VSLRMSQAEFDALMDAKNPGQKKKQPRVMKAAPVLPPSFYDGNRIVVILPLPDRRLHPNGGRPHWTIVRKLVEETKALAYGTAKETLKGAMPGWTAAHGLCRIYLTRSNVADEDDIRAWFKSYIDGIALAGVVTNDRVIRWEKDELGADRMMPRVELEIIRGDEKNK